MDDNEEFQKHKQDTYKLTQSKAVKLGLNYIFTKQIETNYINNALLKSIYEELSPSPYIWDKFGPNEFYLKVRVGKYLKKQKVIGILIELFIAVTTHQ